MAHAQRISQLAEGLVHSINGKTTDGASFKKSHERVIKGLKDQSHARTNQFDVNSKLEGLVEKFSVLNRDPLADALRDRLNELPETSKWLPEHLSLLLCLSDKPATKSDLDDIEGLPGPLATFTLTWEDILSDDPRREESIWDDIERGHHSSEDDLSLASESDEDGPTTKVDRDYASRLANQHLTRVDKEALSTLYTPENGSEPVPIEFSELEIVRETLCMLHGLPGRIYRISNDTGLVSIEQCAPFKASFSQMVLDDILGYFARIGGLMNTLRRWTRRTQRFAYLQSCQSAARTEVAAFGEALARLERQYISPQEPVIVSLPDLRSKVEAIARPLLVLSDGVQHVGQGPFDLLDALHREACVAKLTGDVVQFTMTSRILLAGVKTYLRPISTWIQAGQIDARDETFFVRERDPACHPGRIWEQRYDIRMLSNGQVSAPAFIQPLTAKIFSMGKSRAFLETLEANTKITQDRPLVHENSFEAFGAIDATCDELNPFAQVFSDALDSWVAQQGKDCTPSLCNKLLIEHRLLDTLSALESIFLSKNGRLLQDFADSLFWRMDSSLHWDDTFLISELAQGTLGTAQHVESANLTVHLVDSGGKDIVRPWSSIRALETLQMNYHLPWPLQNVTGCASALTYAKGFTFLLQVYRATCLLRQHCFTLRRRARSRAERSYRTSAQLKTHFMFVAFVDVLYAHIVHSARLSGRALHDDMRQAAGIDAMAQIWASHSATMATWLLVNDELQSIRERLVDLLVLCETFCDSSRVVHGDDGGGGGRAKMETPGAGDQSRSFGTAEDFAMSRDVSNALAVHGQFCERLASIVARLRGVQADGKSELEELAARLSWCMKAR